MHAEAVTLGVAQAMMGITSRRLLGDAIDWPPVHLPGRYALLSGIWECPRRGLTLGGARPS